MSYNCGRTIWISVVKVIKKSHNKPDYRGMYLWLHVKLNNIEKSLYHFYRWKITMLMVCWSSSHCVKISLFRVAKFYVGHASLCVSSVQWTGRTNPVKQVLLESSVKFSFIAHNILTLSFFVEDAIFKTPCNYFFHHTAPNNLEQKALVKFKVNLFILYLS